MWPDPRPRHSRRCTILVQVRRPEWTLRPDPVPTGNLDSVGLMKALLAHGARVDAPLPSPPERAQSGVDVDERIPPPGGGATPLWLAARGPDPEAMRLLVAAGANPMVTTEDGVTLLMSAAGIDYRQGPREKLETQVLEAVALALELGADVTVTDAMAIPPCTARRSEARTRRCGSCWSGPQRSTPRTTGGECHSISRKMPAMPGHSPRRRRSCADS